MDPIYSVLILVCVVASLGMCFHARSNPAIPLRSKNWFTFLYICTLTGALAEFTSCYMDVHQTDHYLHLAVKVLEFSVTPTLPVLMSFGCGMERSARPIWIAVLVHAGIEVLLAPFGKVIIIDENGVYHRGDWYIVYMSIYAVSFIYLLTLFVILSRRFRNRDLFTLLATLASVLCGVIPSIIHSSTRTAFLGITMTAVILYVYYEGLTQQDMVQELTESNDQIHSMQQNVLIGVADLIESRDHNTGTHVKNTANYVELLANAAMEEGIYKETLSERYVKMTVRAAPLHDVGKIAIPDSILQKPGKLTDEEFEIMKSHAPEGGRIIRDLLDGITDNEYLQIAFEVANYHHEKWDGSGYPVGLKGEEIPVCARLMAIADVYDALTMERVYKKAFPAEKALAIIEEDSGKHFDPLLGPLFVRIMRERYPFTPKKGRFTQDV